MRFHVVSLPHTHTTEGFSACAYTEKVRNFCRMMMDRGHEVFLYSGEKNTAPCTEHVSCISETDRLVVVGDRHYTEANFDYSSPGSHWIRFNNNVIAAVQVRAKKEDFLCVIAGLAQKQIADALPALTCVEFGVGYGGTFSRFKVYESYAWMHTSYGNKHSKPNDPHSIDGQWFDAVIPGYLDPDAFPYRGRHRRGNDYFLYVGRIIDRKGIAVAVDACKTAGKRLVVAGPGAPPPGVEYVGVVDPEERGRLMSGATALLCPTIYIEPFGNVAIEAQACGTPVISTDWGAFTETVVHGVTGYRCRTLREFVEAMDKVRYLDPALIRRHVLQNYSLKVIGKRYEEHFERLLQLWDSRGWALMPDSGSATGAAA